MITENIEKAIHTVVEAVLITGESRPYVPGEVNEHHDDVVAEAEKQIKSFIRAEAINLADKIIGKDIVLHNLTDTHGDTFLDPSEKAIYDKQVQQRIELAKYQNPPQVGPTGPEQINDELSENEA